MTDLEQRTLTLTLLRVVKLGETLADHLNQGYGALNEARALIQQLLTAMGAPKDVR